MLPPRSYARISHADTWEEIWEAGPYYERISELLEQAQDFAAFVGWQIDSRLPLPGPNGTETLKQKILRICEKRKNFHFYFLIWDHAYIYVLERERWQGRIWDEIHPRVHFVFDNRHPLGGSHHEKLCLIDDKTAFCGGIDLCDERWDSPYHFHFDPRRSLSHRQENHGPYHDLAVQVTGPVCREVHTHIARRWRKLTSIPFPSLHKGGLAETSRTSPNGYRVYFSRTLAPLDRGVQGTIMPTREIEFLFKNLIDRAQNRILLEGQYYWSEELNDVLITKMHQMRGKNFEIILVLADLSKTKSLTRHMNSFELKLLEKLRRASQYSGTRLVLGYPYSYPHAHESGPQMKSVYVHSKVIVVDDEFISIGSANFAARALRLDSEVNLTLEAKDAAQRAHIAGFSNALLDHWNIRAAPPASSTHRHSSVVLREINPALLLDPFDQRNALAKKFFDPNVSGLYCIKTRLLRRAKRIAKRPAAILLLTPLALWLLARGFDTRTAALALLTTLLALDWLLPTPFVITALLAGIISDAATGAEIGVAAAWIASLLGYATARAFPSEAERYYRRISSTWRSKRPAQLLGARNFASAVSVVLDPQLSVQSKIAYPGLRYIPLPWFVLTNGFILPALLYLGVFGAITLAERALGGEALQWARTHSLLISGSWLALMALKWLRTG